MNGGYGNTVAERKRHMNTDMFNELFKTGKLCLLTARMKGESLSNGAISVSQYCVGYMKTAKDHAVNVMELMKPIVDDLCKQRDDYLTQAEKAETKEGARSARDNARCVAAKIKDAKRLILALNPRAEMGAAFAALQLQDIYPALKVNTRIEGWRAVREEEARNEEEARKAEILEYMLMARDYFTVEAGLRARGVAA